MSVWIFSGAVVKSRTLEGVSCPFRSRINERRGKQPRIESPGTGLKFALFAAALLSVSACTSRESRCERAKEIYLREGKEESDAVLQRTSAADRAVIQRGAERELSEAAKNFIPVCMKRVDAELDCIAQGPKKAKADTVCRAAMWRLDGDLISTLDAESTRNALTEPIGSFSVSELIEEFDQNEVSAAAKYQGRLVKLTDRVTDVGAGNGHSILTLGKEKIVAAAKFKSDSDVLFAKKGEKASVQCLLSTRINGLLTLTDCELVR